MKDPGFAVSIKADDLGEIELIKLLSSHLPNRRWRDYDVETIEDDEPEYTWTFQARAKADDVTEEDAIDLFTSIKRILHDNGYETDDYPYK